MKEVFETRMDDFLTPRQKALRARVRGQFEDGERAGRPEGESLEEFFAELRKEADGPGLLGWVLVIEEVSSRSPLLGKELSGKRAPVWGDGLPVSSIAAAASIGAGAFVLEACARAARDKGMFESVLMEAGRLQQALADFAAGLEAVRFETYRSLLLVEKGEKEQGGDELERAAARAAGLRDEILRLAAGLLGEDWLRDRLPPRPAEDRKIPGELTERKERSEP